MVGRKNQDYPFIKETIKKRPVNKKEFIRRLLTAVLCGIVFGLCASLTIAVFLPSLLEVFGEMPLEKETVRLYSPTSGQAYFQDDSQQAETSGNAEITVGPTPVLQEEAGQADETMDESGTDSLTSGTGTTEDSADHLEDIYEEIKEIAREPQKALVRVSGIGENQDLLDHSSLTYGDEEGIIFLKNQEAFYVLTVSDNLGAGENFRIKFSTGDSAEGTLCGEDSRIGLVVIRVPMQSVEEETKETVPAVSIARTSDQQQADPVIAIGSPTGDYEALVYGNITSVYGRYQIADGEYTMLTTDMVGSGTGGGVLLDMDGQMTGIIVMNGDDDGTVIRAVSAAQLTPLLETLSNGKSIRYMGILGETVTEEQAENSEIPRGIYIDSVEPDSPAMEAGIQSGDILCELNGNEVLSMEEYSAALQELPLWQRTPVSLYRRNPSGEYVEIQLNVLIKRQ